jgi:hypothetical protein
MVAGVDAGEGEAPSWAVAPRSGEALFAPASRGAAFVWARKVVSRSRMASAARRSRRATRAGDSRDIATSDAAPSMAETIGRGAPLATDPRARKASANTTSSAAMSASEPHAHLDRMVNKMTANPRGSMERNPPLSS